ncbi:hypothetical protein B0A48_14579 [Cryoendolithus antarcticus]|uniref:DASH complex subunit SPC34 n=1 Tax=Cryoendolithus antarcticus TaxID=1507870 RepID=A0A1V8SL50_9PEZI|nr:hypothetical protein B0A48_14579 [Cryoendolithus antarcticus]
MASLLSSHLEQISLCSTSIADLSFPGPKIFMNALLSTQDITALIRDTEAHERALYHLAAPSLPQKPAATDYSQHATQASRRATVYPAYAARQPKNKAVAAVLGGDLYQATRRPEAGLRPKGEIDVEVLLQGAEKLAAVYPIPGATARMSELRRRQHQLEANVAHYEERVARQTRELDRMKGRWESGDGVADGEAVEEQQGMDECEVLTKEDLEREEEEVRELERKKRGLEERVTGMERDLGGLMR